MDRYKRLERMIAELEIEDKRLSRELGEIDSRLEQALDSVADSELKEHLAALQARVALQGKFMMKMRHMQLVIQQLVMPASLDQGDEGTNRVN